MGVHQHFARKKKQNFSDVLLAGKLDRLAISDCHQERTGADAAISVDDDDMMQDEEVTYKDEPKCAAASKL